MTMDACPVVVVQSVVDGRVAALLSGTLGLQVMEDVHHQTVGNLSSASPEDATQLNTSTGGSESLIRFQGWSPWERGQGRGRCARERLRLLEWGATSLQGTTEEEETRVEGLYWDFVMVDWTLVLCR